MPVWLLLVGLATGASGQIYRCTGADGKTLWQDLPCEDARSEQRMPADRGEGAASTASLEDWLRDLKQRPQHSPDSRPAPPKSRTPGVTAPARTEPVGPLARTDERLLAECSQQFLECSDSSDSRMDACVSALPRCNGALRSGCCPSSCVDRYLGLRRSGTARARAVRSALLDERQGSCAAR